jgi:hypothetical protein
MAMEPSFPVLWPVDRIPRPRPESFDYFDLVGEHVCADTVIPTNMNKYATQIFELVLDRSFGKSFDRPLVTSNIFQGTAVGFLCLAAILSVVFQMRIF